MKQKKAKNIFHCLVYQDLFSSKKIISARRIIAVSVLLQLSGRIFIFFIFGIFFFLFTFVISFCGEY